MTEIPCACGCGTLIEDKDKQGRPRGYIKNHHCRGKQRSEKTKKKISEAQKGKIVTDETKKKMSKNHADVSGEENPFFGKRHTIDSKDKMSQNSKGKNAGKKRSEETRRQMSEAQRARFSSPDERKKISDAAKKRFTSPDERKKHSISCTGINKGKKHSEEAKKKMSESHCGEKHYNYGNTGEKCCWYGRQHTDETKEKMSVAQKGHVVSDETRRKISEANKGKTAGEKSHLWKGGISFEPYCPKFNDAFKEFIREKFGRVCFLCPTTEEENGEKLSVHHVNYNKDCLCDDSECEFVPLCIRCHAKTNFNREYWENLILTNLEGMYG